MYAFNWNADPLDDEQLGDLIEAHYDQLIVLIDGVPYCDEDLYRCDCCGVRSPCCADFNDEGHCEDCAAKAAEEYADEQSLRRWHQTMVL